MACDFSAFNVKSFLAIHAATSIIHVSILANADAIDTSFSTVT